MHAVNEAGSSPVYFLDGPNKRRSTAIPFILQAKMQERKTALFSVKWSLVQSLPKTGDCNLRMPVLASQLAAYVVINHKTYGIGQLRRPADVIDERRSYAAVLVLP